MNRHQQILDSVTEFAVIATSRDGVVTDWNTGAERILGWASNEIVGGSADAIFTPEDRAAGRPDAEMARTLRDGRGIDERWHMKRDGSRFWASGEMMPLRDDAGGHVGFVKVLRDRTEQHLTGERLRDLEDQLRQAQEAGGVGLCTVDLASGLLTGTPGFSRLHGLAHQDNRPADDFGRLVVPEDRHLVPTDATRRTGKAPTNVVYRIRRADTGEVRWIEGKGDYRQGADGRPIRFVGVARDVTEQVLARRERDEEREQLAAIFSQSPSFMALLHGPEHRFERVNPGYTELVEGRDVTGRTVAEALPDAVAQGFVDILDKVYRSGEAYHATGTRYAVQAAPDAPVVPRYVDFVYQPIRDADGKVSGIFVEGVDVTERIAADRRLRETQDRYRALAENVDVGMCVVEMKFDAAGRAVDYRILEGNDAYERHTGLVGSVGKWVSEVAPGLEPHWFDLYGKVALTGESVRFEQGAETLGGRWFEVQAHRVSAFADRHVAILFTDVTERKRTEERRATLNAELAHRLKNNLALVQSIATQTLRTAPDVASARRILNARIQALAKAHDVLVTGRRDAASVAEIVRAAESLHDEGGRVRFAGPEVTLGPQASLTLSLILHELATNAAKYGSLSVPEGQVEVAWSVAADPATRLPTLTVEWRETGGPPVAAPTHRSFGTRLIEMGLGGTGGGTSDIDYAPTGLTCRIVAPLTELQRDNAPST